MEFISTCKVHSRCGAETYFLQSHGKALKLAHVNVFHLRGYRCGNSAISFFAKEESWFLN
jgi:hypothetical protein